MYGLQRAIGYFNPRSPHGERLGRRERPKTAKRFQSTLPARGATELDMERCDTEEQAFQSTLPARGATVPGYEEAVREFISIHAPRTGSDDGGSLTPPDEG